MGILTSNKFTSNHHYVKCLIGFCHRLIRSKGSAVEAANLFYGAVLFYIYDQWKNEKLSLVQSGHLLKSKFYFNLIFCLHYFNSICNRG